MKRLLAALFMLGGSTVLPHYAFAQPADSKAQIEQVVKTFRTAIINKDEEAFLKLFLKEDITWAGVTTDKWGKESWQMVRTADGWKIAAVVWSQELNPTPPPAKETP